MLEVSDSARSLLKELLEERTDPAHIFRLSKDGDAFGLRFDVPAEGDIMFQFEDTDVLAVAGDAAETLDAFTIDREESPEGPRLTLVLQSEA